MLRDYSIVHGRRQRQTQKMCVFQTSDYENVRKISGKSETGTLTDSTISQNVLFFKRIPHFYLRMLFFV